MAGFYKERPLRLKRIRRIEKRVSYLTRLRLIYGWGGARNYSTGHMDEPRGAGSKWTDCSGFAQDLCEVGEIKLDNYIGSTWSLENEGLAGESPWFTLFIKNTTVDDSHVIIRLRRRNKLARKLFGEFRWAECGGYDNPNSGGGPSWFRPTAARIAEFPIHRHFKEFEDAPKK